MNQNKNKNLVYVSHWRFPSEKTMSPLIMRSCEEFAKRGYTVELWIPKRKNKDFVDIDAHSYHRVSKNFVIRRLFVLDFMGAANFSLPFFIMVFTFNLSVFFRTLFLGVKDRLFFCHDQRDVILLTFLKPKIIYEIHDFYYSTKMWINNFTFKRAAGFVVTNKLKIEILHKDFGIPYEKMAHEPNAVDIKMFSSDISKEDARNTLSLPQNEKIALYTGHLFDWKGVYTLAEASEFVGKDTRIYFVGGTQEDRKKLQDFIKEKNLSRVVFLPHQEHAKMPIFFRAADVLVLPNTGKVKTSAIETSPVKLFEYLCSGRPISASDLPSIRNVVDERSVFFFTPDDAKSMGSVIEYVIKNTDEVEDKTKYARALVEQYEWSKRFDRITDFIQNIL